MMHAALMGSAMGRAVPQSSYGIAEAPIDRPQRGLEFVESKVRANGHDLTTLANRLEGVRDRIFGEPSSVGMGPADKAMGTQGSLPSIAMGLEEQDAAIKRLYAVVERLETA